MKELETIVSASRFVTIANKNGKIVIEANCWLPEVDDYTVNLRGEGADVNDATMVLLMSMDEYGIL